MPRRSSLLIIFIFFSLYKLYALENDVSLNTIISFYKLDVSYDALRGEVSLFRKNSSAVIRLGESYARLDGKYFFLYGLVYSRQGQFFISRKGAELLSAFFSHSAQQNLFPEGEDDTSLVQNSDQKKAYYNIPDDASLIDTHDTALADEEKRDTVLIPENWQDEQVTAVYHHESEPEDKKIKAIIIDPGHGGKDPGAVGYNDIREKDIVLKVGLILKDALKERFPDKKIILTRDVDNFIPLEKRAAVANYVYGKYGTSLFISIHVNASRSSKPYGFETWYLVGEHQRQVVEEGAVDDSDVADVLNSIINDEIYRESQELAKFIQDRLEERIGDVSKNRGIKEEIYFVIRKAIMPAVLVEIGFNTNKYEAIRLTKYEYLNRIASGILDGIKDFVDTYENSDGYTRQN